MIGATFCSGIGAPEVAAPWIDWQFASEIEPFPRAVLQERFGFVPPEDHKQGDPLLWGDMTDVSPDTFRQHGIPFPEIIAGGTPCQSFSIAGKRDGLADDRGNLTLKFVEICHAIQSARPDGKLTVLWENVPGVLSDKENAFGCFLAGLVGADDALYTPDRESWPGVGMVEGPRARAAWRILDAQYFGVAQRRRRLFVVVDFGNAIDPAAVLFERQSLQGNTPPRRETGKGFAADVAPGLVSSGRGVERVGESRGQDPVVAKWPAETAPTLNAHFGDKMGLENQHALAGGGFSCLPSTAMCLNAVGMGRQDAETETLIPTHGGGFDVAQPLRGEGFDASEDGTGRGTPLVSVFDPNQITSKTNRSTPKPELCHTLPCSTIPPVAFDCKGSEVQTVTDGPHPPLRALGHKNSHQIGGGHAAVAYDMRGRDDGAQFEGPHDTANMRAASGRSSRSYVAQPMAVRRLTPTECHRLQGFPDDHCAITYRGKPAADGPQYKALGNSMAVPVIVWILNRIKEATT